MLEWRTSIKSKLDETKLKDLYKKLGYQFVNPALLQAALTHRSKGSAHNERLEFLGDSLLNYTITVELYQRFPKAKEGELTRMRAVLVRGETLALIARDLQLGEFLQLGVGELKSGGQQRDSILADAVEAIIGALFLDGGLLICQERIQAWYASRINELSSLTSQKDPKTSLQEYLQAKRLGLPEYHVVEVFGDPHDPTFKVECRITLLDKPVEGIANSRRKAEQTAAEAVLKLLKDKGK